MKKLIIRTSDGALFEPSFPDNYNEGRALADAISAAFNNKPCWYFRRIEPIKKRWWHFKQRYKRTGEVWEPNASEEFELLKTS